MIYRSLFVAYSHSPECVTLIGNPSYYAALAFDEDKVFLYTESNEMDVNPEKLVKGELLQHPNGKAWERAIDIFHYSMPVYEQQWHRKIKKTPCFRLNRLRYEKISSYVFYHYQYQEECPGDGDRYGIIFLLGDMLIFYEETPTEKETEKIAGALSTTNTPHHQWGNLMEEHFAEEWRPIQNLSNSGYIGFGLIM